MPLLSKMKKIFIMVFNNVHICIKKGYGKKITVQFLLPCRSDRTFIKLEELYVILIYHIIKCYETIKIGNLMHINNHSIFPSQL